MRSGRRSSGAIYFNDSRTKPYSPEPEKNTKRNLNALEAQLTEVRSHIQDGDNKVADELRKAAIDHEFGERIVDVMNEISTRIMIGDKQGAFGVFRLAGDSTISALSSTPPEILKAFKDAEIVITNNTDGLFIIDPAQSDFLTKLVEARKNVLMALMEKTGDIKGAQSRTQVAAQIDKETQEFLFKGFSRERE